VVRRHRHASDIPAERVCSVRILFVSLYSLGRARRAHSRRGLCATQAHTYAV